MILSRSGPIEKKSILIVVNSLNVGGPQKSLIGLLQRLDQSIYEVSVLVLQGIREGDLSEHVPNGINIIESPSAYRAATLPRGELVESVGELFRDQSFLQRVQLISSLGLAAVRDRTGSRVRQRFWCFIAPHLPKIPGHFDLAVGILGQSTYAIVDLVSANHKYHWVRSDTRVLRRNETIESSYFRRLSGALAVSEECSRIYVDTYPYMTDRVFIYKNDIPVLEYNPLAASAALSYPGYGHVEHTLKLLTIARLDPLKGLDLAIAACARLVSAGYKIDWVVLGEGPERSNLEQLIEQQAVTSQFRLVGSVLDTSKWLEWSDIYVHPSRAEGRSNAVEEAKRFGVAVVATRYPTVGDQICDGVSGVVVDLSSDALANGILMLRSDPSLANRLAERAREDYLSERDDPNELFARLVRGNSLGPA